MEAFWLPDQPGIAFPMFGPTSPQLFRNATMSLHGTFVSKGGFAAHRNVLSRAERIERLKADSKWEQGKNSVFNLPKVRNIKMT